MEILGERPVWSMSGGEMVSTLDATYAEIARLETLALHLIHGVETIGYAQELGAGTTARLLTFRYRVDATKARRDVHLANSLEKYPAVAAALPELNPADTDSADTDSAGRVGDGGVGDGVLLHPTQAEAIVSTLDKLPTTVPVEDLAVAEHAMVELGRTHGPLDLRKAGVQIRNRLDTDGPEPAEQKAYDRETLTMQKADQGVTFKGYLANENAELLRTLIHTHAKPRKTIDGALDPRPRDKRQADALTTVLNLANNPTSHHRPTTSTGNAGAERSTGTEDTADPARTAGTAGSAESGGTPLGGTGIGEGSAPGFIPGHGPKPHITVTIDFNDLKAATADKTGHLTYGDALSAATIRRLACDAQILPIVLGSNSQPLDVGTTVRLATGPIRKALIARDRGCVCCGAPPIYCDAHHVRHWIDGGETKLTNLVLLCKRCHRDLHAGHWNIHITNGTAHVTRPTWATPDPIPRSTYRPPTTTLCPTATTPGAAARAWPRDTDPPWITPEDAARLNPWGEGSDARPRGVPKKPVGESPIATGVDVWQDSAEPHDSTTTAA